MADDKNTPPAPVMPDLSGAYMSGDNAALRKAVHDRVVTQVQTYVNTPSVIQGKTEPTPPAPATTPNT